MAFPTSSLTNNQVHKEGNRAFVYDSALGVWDQVREVDRTKNEIITDSVSNTSLYSGDATASGNLTVTGDLVPSTPLSHRNMIINGGMTVWQRTTAATAAPDTYSTVDRWLIGEGTAGAYTSQIWRMTAAEQATTGHTIALKCVVTDDIAATCPAGDYAALVYFVEAHDCQHLLYGTSAAKNITLSFWVKSSVAGTYSFGIDKRDSTVYSISHDYTIFSPDTWEQKIITITPTAGSTSLITGAGGVIQNDNGQGLRLKWALALGTNKIGSTTNTWNTSGNWSHAANTNWMADDGNTFYITGVQLELGSTATPFEHRSYADELRRCQRYFEWASDYTGWAASTGSCDGGMSFKVDKRSTSSTVAFTNLTQSLAHPHIAGITPTGGSISQQSTSGCYMSFVGTGAFSSPNVVSFYKGAGDSVQIIDEL